MMDSQSRTLLQNAAFDMFWSGKRGEELQTALMACNSEHCDDRWSADDVAEIAREAVLHCSRIEVSTDASRIFSEVDLAGIEAAESSPQEWAWGQYMPAGEVTVLAAHGGTGKSTIGLHLSVCGVLGRPYLGFPTHRGRKFAFYSAEDRPAVVLRRLARICRLEGIEPAELAGRLLILDATAGDPVLFAIRRQDGTNHGITTAAYLALSEYVQAHDIDVLIIDNASDVFDADEINRTHVRAFLRSMVRLVRARNGAVLLLAHVDKGTSRAGRNPIGGETYSGSTAWHNSVRSRLFLVEVEPGRLELRHEKSNLGRKCDPLSLDWPEGGLPMVQEFGPTSVIAERVRDTKDLQGLLALVHEFDVRGEWVSTSQSSPRNPSRLLAGEAAFPKHRKPHQVFDLLRSAERNGLIERGQVRTVDRKLRECWKLTYAGKTYIGAPTAPTAPTIHVDAPAADCANRANPPSIDGGWRAGSGTGGNCIEVAP